MSEAKDGARRQEIRFEGRVQSPVINQADRALLQSLVDTLNRYTAEHDIADVLMAVGAWLSAIASSICHSTDLPQFSDAEVAALWRYANATTTAPAPGVGRHSPQAVVPALTGLQLQLIGSFIQEHGLGSTPEGGRSDA